jgi:hypothetical protein
MPPGPLRRNAVDSDEHVRDMLHWHLRGRRPARPFWLAQAAKLPFDPAAGGAVVGRISRSFPRRDVASGEMFRLRELHPARTPAPVGRAGSGCSSAEARPAARSGS